MNEPRKRARLDTNKFSHKMLVASLGMMVDDDGLSPHEVKDVVEEAFNRSFHSLVEMHKEYLEKHKVN